MGEKEKSPYMAVLPIWKMFNHWRKELHRPALVTSLYVQGFYEPRRSVHKFYLSLACTEYSILGREKGQKRKEGKERTAFSAELQVESSRETND